LKPYWKISDAVTTAATVEQAISLIKAQDFDAPLLDVNLKGINSRPVPDMLAARGVPFAFCTGNASHYMMDGYQDRPILRKPFTDNNLIAAISGLLSR
jgi:CheY-like chemotaxis protein